MIKIFLSRGHTEVLAGTPLLVITHITNVRKQKRRGSLVSLRAYPNYQAFALPPCKDKQRKACPRRAIYMHTLRHTDSLLVYIRKDSMPILWHTPYYIYKKGIMAAGRYKINPRGRFLLHHRCTWFPKLRSLVEQTVTLRKRPFETGRTTALRSRSIDVVLTCPPSHEQAFRVQR